MDNGGKGPPDVRDDDAGFVARCQGGEMNAFEVLVERHQKRMLNTAYRMLGDYQEACDVVQEAFISAYKAIGGFRQESKFSTWMTTIVLNHSRNRLSQRSARDCRECRSLDESMEKREGRMVREPQSDAESGIDMLERKHREARVQECIGALDGEQKEVLVLREMQGLSYEEIGGMLKVPDGTVKSRLFRARIAMKDCLSDLLREMR